MASEQTESTILYEAPCHHLLLLTSPIDGDEAIYEILEPGTEYDPKLTQRSWEIISDSVMVSKHFGEAGKAALLNTVQFEKILEYANRHRAVYQMKTRRLDEQQFREASISAMGLKFPLWLFRPEAPTADERHKTPECRPARLTGFEVVKLNDGAKSLKGPAQYIKGQPEAATAGSSIGKAKLRPAQDVISRLRHDAAFDEQDYRVVYEDRFCGDMTIDLALWHSDVSEDEFVPQHRILRFERKWDGIPLWDRRRRVDLVFGGDGAANGRVTGFAVKVESLEGLVRLAGVSTSDDWARIQPAQFEFIDEEETTCKGITC